MPILFLYENPLLHKNREIFVVLVGDSILGSGKFIWACSFAKNRAQTIPSIQESSHLFSIRIESYGIRIDHPSGDLILFDPIEVCCPVFGENVLKFLNLRCKRSSNLRMVEWIINTTDVSGRLTILIKKSLI
mgnify:CR=1 FL=1